MKTITEFNSAISKIPEIVNEGIINPTDLLFGYYNLPSITKETFREFCSQIDRIYNHEGLWEIDYYADGIVYLDTFWHYMRAYIDGLDCNFCFKCMNDDTKWNKQDEINKLYG